MGLRILPGFKEERRLPEGNRLSQEARTLLLLVVVTAFCRRATLA